MLERFTALITRGINFLKFFFKSLTEFSNSGINIFLVGNSMTVYLSIRPKSGYFKCVHTFYFMINQFERKEVVHKNLKKI